MNLSLQPLVSIITPTYNHEKFIKECIVSCLNQTFKNWEMIIIDDDSQDRTPQIIKKFNDSRIRYIWQEHLGAYKLGITYNKALSIAKGKFIAILEGDDYWPDDKLEHQLPYFDNENVILTYGEYLEVNKYKKPIAHRTIDDNNQIRNNYPVGSMLNQFVKLNSPIHSVTAMIRKEALLKIGGFIQPAYLPLVDYPTWCRLALEGEFRGINKILGVWRRTIKSITFTKEMDIWKGSIRYIQEFLGQYDLQIKRLGLCFNLEELKNFYENFLRNYQLSEHNKGRNYLLLGEPKEAKKSFQQYLRSKQRSLRSRIISVLGIISSYLGVNLFRHLFEPLAQLKRRIFGRSKN